MMSTDTNNPGLENRPADACWNRIGVQGDRSCPRLADAGQCGNCPVFSAAGQRLFDREATPEYLDEWTRQLAAADSTTVAESVSVLLFRIGQEWLAIEARSVVEVIPLRPIHRVPHRTNGFLLGLANIRGELQLCVSLEQGARHRGPADYRNAGRRFIDPVAAADDRRGAPTAPLGVPRRRGGGGSPDLGWRNGKPALYCRTERTLLLPVLVRP